MAKIRTLCKAMWIAPVALTLLGVSGIAASLPGVGNGDALCKPVANGPTVCHVREGQGDDLVELVMNGTNVPIFINGVTAGPIALLGGDPTDVITSDPIGGNPFTFFPVPPDCNSGPTLQPGQACFFTQSFTTGTPGDIDDNTFLLDDGESAMFFNLTFTPLGAIAGPNPANNAQQNNIAGPIGNGAPITVQIQSADVFVTDVPEPAGLALFGSSLVGLWGMLRRTVRRNL